MLEQFNIFPTLFEALQSSSDVSSVLHETFCVHFCRHLFITVLDNIDINIAKRIITKCNDLTASLNKSLVHVHTHSHDNFDQRNVYCGPASAN